MAHKCDKTTTEALIEAVKEYPILYNPAHSSYKDRIQKGQVWHNIAETIQEKDGDTVKHKWKNLRDAYNKHLRSLTNETGPGAKLTKRYKTWPWVEQMSFLRPYFIEFDSIFDLDREKNDPPSKKISNKKFSPKTQRYLRKRAFQQSIVNDRNKSPSLIEKEIRIEKKDMDYDDIDLIFLGYAKTIKQMPKNLQAKVKFQIARVIMEAELEQLEESRNKKFRILEKSSPDYEYNDDDPLSPQQSSNSCEIKIESQSE